MATVASIRAELVLEAEKFKRGVEQSKKDAKSLADEIRKHKQVVKDAETAYKELTGEAVKSAKEIEREQKRAAREVEQAHRKATQEARKSAREQKQALEEVGTAGAAVFAGLAVAIGLATREAAQFEQQIANLKSVTTLSAEQVERAKVAAQEFGPAYGIAADQAAAALTEFTKAGIDTERLISGELKSAFALQVAGELSVAEAASFAATALNTYRDENLKLARVADIAAGSANASATSVREMGEANRMLGPVAAQMGATFEEVNAALAIFANNGLRGLYGPFAV